MVRFFPPHVNGKLRARIGKQKKKMEIVCGGHWSTIITTGDDWWRLEFNQFRCVVVFVPLLRMTYCHRCNVYRFCQSVLQSSEKIAQIISHMKMTAPAINLDEICVGKVSCSRISDKLNVVRRKFIFLYSVFAEECRHGPRKCWSINEIMLIVWDAKEMFFLSLHSNANKILAIKK